MTTRGTVEPTEHDPTIRGLMHSEAPGLMRFARRLTGHQADADDLVQETLARAWRLRASFDPGGNGAAWLRTIAFRLHCDLRTRRRPEPSTVELDTRACQADDRVALRDELRNSLAPLSEIERVLLLGFHRDGRSIEQLAEQHSMPCNTVKSHLHRARRRLRPLTDSDPS